MSSPDESASLVVPLVDVVFSVEGEEVLSGVLVGEIVSPLSHADEAEGVPVHDWQNHHLQVVGQHAQGPVELVVVQLLGLQLAPLRVGELSRCGWLVVVESIHIHTLSVLDLRSDHID